MPIPIEDVAAGVLAPLLICSLILGVWCRFAQHDTPLRHATAVAFAAGFCVAFALFAWTPILPKEHWQWLFYLAIVATILGVASVAEGIGWLERCSLYLVVAAATAWFLVPDWKSIETVRHLHLLVVGAGVLFLCVASEPLAKKRPGRALPLALSATSLAASVVLLSSGNLKFAQLGGAVLFSLLGCTLAALIWPRKVSLRGAVPVCVVLLGGLLYVGRIHSFSQVPLASYLLVAMAPLGLWAEAIMHRSHRPIRWQVVTRIIAVLLPLAIGVGLASRAW